MNELQNIFDQQDWKQIEDISIEYGRLMDWFNSVYPEGTIRLDVNSDQRHGVLKYKLTVITGKEATPHNQGLFTSEIVINKERFEDIFWMSNFKKNLVPKYQESITKSMNRHYLEEKEKHE